MPRFDYPTGNGSSSSSSSSSDRPEHQPNQPQSNKNWVDPNKGGFNTVDNWEDSLIPNRARPGEASTTSSVDAAAATGNVKDKGAVQSAIDAQTFDPGGDWQITSGDLEELWAKFGPDFMNTDRSGDYADAMKGEFENPGMGEQQIQGALGQFNLESASEQEYARSAEAGLGPYYDRAKQRASADINRELSARGSFGATAGIGMIGQAMTDLEAARANREADFRLEAAGQSDQHRMARLLGGGQLGIMGQQAHDQRISGGLELAMGADAMGISRMATGAGIAGNSQLAKENRINTGVSNAQQAAGMGMEAIEQSWTNAQGADRELFEDYWSKKLGMTIEGFRQMMADQAIKREAMSEVTGDIQEAGGYVSDAFSAGSGGG